MMIITNGKENVRFIDLIDNKEDIKNKTILLARCENRYYELFDIAPVGKEIEFIGNEDMFGNKTYMRTLEFIFIDSVLSIFSDARISLEHSISKSIFGEIHKFKALDEQDILLIKKKMQDTIDKDIKINKVKMKREEAINIFDSYGMKDKVKLLKTLNREYISLYELNGRYDYFYGYMAYSTGIIKTFDLMYYDPGFILRFPQRGVECILPDFIEQKKLFTVFNETGKWLNIMNVADVSSLNNIVKSGDVNDLIRISEALHEKKIAYIADMIYDRKETKLVLIAGPSSSGKTTFLNRLCIQLRVNGLIPIPISLDNYFVDRDKTPIDENGKRDYECIEAIDLKLFNEHLKSLFEGKEVELPEFNFRTGKREWSGKKFSIPYNGVVVVEGIHGLNKKLTSSIDDKYIFKIYISALTQLNIDGHNRIATTDVRKIRRVVRDYLSRGYDAKGTLDMWDSIKRGEEKNIFVYQEKSDVMFNSMLVYELCVLKKYAIYELNKITKDDECYEEALRLKSLLNLFVDIDEDKVPSNSLLREFIGGSCFYKY